MSPHCTKRNWDTIQLVFALVPITTFLSQSVFTTESFTWDTNAVTRIHRTIFDSCQSTSRNQPWMIQIQSSANKNTRISSKGMDMYHRSRKRMRPMMERVERMTPLNNNQNKKHVQVDEAVQVARKTSISFILIFSALFSFLHGEHTFPLSVMRRFNFERTREAIERPYPESYSHTRFVSDPVLSMRDSRNSNSMLLLSSLLVTFDPSSQEIENMYPNLDTAINSVVNNFSNHVMELDQEKNDLGLRYPTESRPQIQLSEEEWKDAKRVKTKETKVPLVEGLVYFMGGIEKNARIDPYDLLILTVAKASEPDIIVAGAKMPLFSVTKFPFRFQLYNANLAPTLSKTDIENIRTVDFRVSAYICPSGDFRSGTGFTDSSPCGDKDSSFHAFAIAKLLSGQNIPGMNRDDSIRTPVALPLTPSNS